MQISTWILLPMLVLHFALFLTPTLPIWLSIPFSILYSVFAIASAYYTYVTTKTDSMDERLYEHLRGKPHPNVIKRKEKEAARKLKTNEIMKDIISATSGESTAPEAEDTADEEGQEEELKYCWVCQTEVHVQSMHCKYCDKCVSHFDHHCMWLNTCIGAENYATFFKCVWCLTLLTTVHLIALIMYIIGYFTKLWGVRERSGWLDEGKPEIIMGINLGVAVFIFAVVAMVVQLLMFHQALKRDGLTTYQFIMKDSQRKREKAVYTARVKERRSAELSRMRLGGGGFMEMSGVKMGAWKVCKPCDPVRRSIDEENSVEDVRNNVSRGNDESVNETQ